MENLIMVDKKETKEALKRQISDVIPTPTRKIDYQVDTLKQESLNSTIAYFTPRNNTITVNHTLNENSPLEKSKSTKAHEQKHRDNQAAGIGSLPMSLEQHYKINMHDEISATMAELLHIRQEYINAPTSEDRKKILERSDARKFYYYTNALKKGKLNPFTPNIAEFEKEMKFIAVETQTFWMENFADYYDKHQICDETLLYFYRHDYEELKDNPKNYATARKSAYTIGGIDFSQYVNDIPCINKNIPKADKLLTANEPHDEIKKCITPSENADNGLGFVSEYYRYQTVSLAQRAELQALSYIASDLEFAMFIRKKWLKCETDKERATLMKDLDIKNTFAETWLKAANEGKIHPQRLVIPKEEQHFLGALIQKETAKHSDISLYDIRDYIKVKSEDKIKSAVQTGEADKNYQKSLKKMFTHLGTDFSSYVSKPGIDLSLLDVAEQKIQAGKKVDTDLDLQEKSDQDYLAVPKITPNPNLSMEQQLRLAKHKMFMENVLIRKPSLVQEGVYSGCNAIEAKYQFELFKIDLKYSLQEKWQKAEQYLETEIANAYKDAVFLPKANDIAYQQELDKIYTVNGINLRSELQKQYGKEQTVENNFSSTQAKKIDAIQSTPILSRVKNKTIATCNKTKNTVIKKAKELKTWAEQKTEATSTWVTEKWDTLTKFFSSKNRKKILTDNKNTGTPQYKQWSPQHRVSPVLYEEIYDMTAPFLQQQQERLKQKSTSVKTEQAFLDAQSKVKTEKFNQRVTAKKQTQSKTTKKSASRTVALSNTQTQNEHY